jgi:late competence protein required for DNA uptake (superfamily II DNA/RNA helicase)
MGRAHKECERCKETKRVDKMKYIAAGYCKISAIYCKHCATIVTREIMA